MVGTLACDRRTTTCCSPTPGPSPAAGLFVLGGAGFAGEGGHGFFITLGMHLRWLPRARIESPFRACACDSRNDNLIFPHPRPLPRDGVVCVGRGWFRGRGGIWVVRDFWGEVL